MKSIYLLEIGEVKDLDWEALGSDLSKIFSLRTKKIGPIEVPDFAFDRLRKQYDSLKIMQDISSISFDSLEKMLAVTSVDLFTDDYNYIFGQGDSPGKISIVSTFRLDPRNFKDNFNKDIYYQRILKEAIHELGHNFGVSHCPDKSCPMHFSNNVTDTDFKKTQLCQKCQNLLEMAK